MTAEVVQRRFADESHEVVRVIGGKKLYRRRPCRKCPFRVDAVGEFPTEAFRLSANTAYDMADAQFGCHEQKTKKPATCAGFLLTCHHNLAVRMAVAGQMLDLSKIDDGGHVLYESYRAMAIANGVDQNDPVLKNCR